MKHYWAYAVVPNDGNNGMEFRIKLRDKCRFILNECYFTMCKGSRSEGIGVIYESDYFQIDLVTQENEKNAENIMKRAVNLLVYITGVPYEIYCLKKDVNWDLAPININMSKKKILKLQEIDFQYKRISRKKELLENVLQLYSLAAKYSVLLEDGEESFFAMFRIVEKIVKDEFGIEYRNIDNGYNDMRDYVKEIITNCYNIKMPLNKIDSFAGNLASELFDKVFSDIYSKIAWFCGKKNINYDENVLARAVKLRNQLAHGENVCINPLSDEIRLINKLSHMCIQEKFFNNIKHCYIDVDILA